jgi:hypothetical protein
VPDPIEAPVTEPLQLADQRPLEPTVPVVESKNHTRTILEVVGGVIAAVLIVSAAGLGFALGHVTATNDRGHDRGAFSQGGATADGPRGGMMGGQDNGQGGFGNGQGMDPRGIDPDGDNWTGGGSMMGTPPTAPTAPTQ